MFTAPTAPAPLRVAFAGGRAGIFDVGVPVLAGEAVESLFTEAEAIGRVGALHLFRTAGWLVGAATVSVAPGLDETAHRLYSDILKATRDWHLARVWNYVPAINGFGADGLENYQLFCRGRSLAFEQQLGGEFRKHLPAASAVGTKAGTLSVIFAACAQPPRHFENPLQVPAYDYPAVYGPRAPSFARATIAHAADGRATIFISGTAAIRGHATVAPASTPAQLECLLENLAEISRTSGLGPNLEGEAGSERHFKIYLRHADDLSVVTATLEEKLLRRNDRVSYLQADICRESLRVEIEATLFAGKSSAQ